MKITYILSIIIISLSLAACFEQNPTYIENYEMNMHTEYFTLEPNKWVQDEFTSFQWFQEYKFFRSKFFNPQHMLVLCYYMNRYNAWEALPSTRIFWTDAGELYSDELWFSHDEEKVYIDYRNTIPKNPLPPADPIKMKVVFIDKAYVKK